MGLWTAVLSLCLLESFHAMMQLSSSTEVISLTGATKDGAAVLVPSMEINKEIVLPNIRWALYAWVKILSDL